MPKQSNSSKHLEGALAALQVDSIVCELMSGIGIGGLVKGDSNMDEGREAFEESYMESKEYFSREKQAGYVCVLCISISDASNALAVALWRTKIMGIDTLEEKEKIDTK